METKEALALADKAHVMGYLNRYPKATIALANELRTLRSAFTKLVKQNEELKQQLTREAQACYDKGFREGKQQADDYWNP